MSVIAGVGLRLNCPAEDIVSLVWRASALAGCAVDALAAPAFKRDESGLQAAAVELGLELLLVDGAALEAAQVGCVTRSAAAAAAAGVASVAEGCALAAAGAGARLLLPRIAGPRVTCALAESASP